MTCLPSVFHLSIHGQRPSGPSALRRLIRLSLPHGQCLCVPCVCMRVSVCAVYGWHKQFFCCDITYVLQSHLCGTTAVFSASCHLFLSEISRDLQREVALIWWGAQPQPAHRLRYREVYFTWKYRYFSQNKFQSKQDMLFERWRIWSNTICFIYFDSATTVAPDWSIIVRNI